MRFSIAVLTMIALVVLVGRTQGAGDRNPGDLSVAIVAVKDKAGTPTINRAGKFQVVFTNQSDKPIRLWSDECQLGHETLSFRVEDSDGMPSLMCKRSASPSAWKNKPPITITILPGKTLAWDVAPAEFFWGERMWKGAPEPNTGKPVTLTAVLEIKATAAAKEHGVRTGRVTSKPLKILVLDANLRTPHEYLWAGCPRQALKIMQADRTWITKKDDKDECTPLHHAARFGFADVSRWLLANGADVNARAYNQFTPLHFADHPEIVKLLIAHKADVEATSNGGTALQTAASHFAHLERAPAAAEREKSRTIIKMLLDAGAEYDICSACYLDDIGRIRVLVADKKQAQNKEALRWAATSGRAKIVKLLLENGADPNTDYYGGLTISYFAVQHADILKLLFDAGADPKVRVEYYGCGRGPQGSTLLHEAVGSVESVKLLLAQGIDVNLTNASGSTVLHRACRYGHAPTVELLLRNRANARATTKDGWTPMSLAASQVRPEEVEDNARYQAVIRALEHAGVELDVFAAISCNDVKRVAKILQTDPKIGEVTSPAGCPALHRAVTLDRKEIVKLLLDKGSNPDIPSREEGVRYKGETALLQAAFWGRLEMAEMLIQRGANVSAKADGGVVPLHEAARMGNVELARLLLKHGAEINAKDDKGNTPLYWASSYRESPEMIKLLRDRGGVR